MNIAPRYNAPFEERYMPVTESGCWLWLGSSNPGGYGRLQVGGRLTLAHRHSFELAFGPIEPGMCVLHTCDTPCCVNPAHLRLGTQKDNVTDMINKKRDGIRGERNAGRKLSRAQVDAIRCDNRGSLIVAAEFHISRSHVYALRRDKFWRHL